MEENNKNNISNVKPRDWISIGEGFHKIRAVVCVIYEDTEMANIEGDVEVVYLNRDDRAINTGVVWEQNHWKFKHSGPNGGYADKYDRLAEFVGILRRK